MKPSSPFTHGFASPVRKLAHSPLHIVDMAPRRPGSGEITVETGRRPAPIKFHSPIHHSPFTTDIQHSTIGLLTESVGKFWFGKAAK